MALSLGFRPGWKVQVGDSVVKCEKVVTPNEVYISVNKGPHLKVTDVERVEILPTVFVSCGPFTDAKYDDYCRLAFEAPRSVSINRIRRPVPA